jgi:hypothetical protein
MAAGKASARAATMASKFTKKIVASMEWEISQIKMSLMDDRGF